MCTLLVCADLRLLMHDRVAKRRAIELDVELVTRDVVVVVVAVAVGDEAIVR